MDGTCTFIYLAGKEPASGYPWSALSPSRMLRARIPPSNRPFESPIGGKEPYLITMITSPYYSTLQDYLWAFRVDVVQKRDKQLYIF